MMYSDSSDDNDKNQSMDVDGDCDDDSIAKSSSSNDDCADMVYVVPTEPPILPSPPPLSATVDDKQIEQIGNLLQEYKDSQAYIESTFCNKDFVENPKFLQNKLMQFPMFGSENKEQAKLNEYSSMLSLKVFNPSKYLKKEDNISSLSKLVDEKIKENERKIQEKKERKEQQKRLKQHQNEYMSQPKFSMKSIRVTNAAKQAILAKKQILNKYSRWDNK